MIDILFFSGQAMDVESAALMEELLAPVPLSHTLLATEWRMPTLAQLTQFRPTLANAIREHRPVAIVALGNHALQALCGTSGVTKNRAQPAELRVGIQKQLTAFEGLRDLALFPKVLTTWHPSFVLRDLNHEEELEEDIAGVVRYVRHLRGEDQSQAVSWKEVSAPYWFVPTLVSNHWAIAYDIETNARPFHDPAFRITMLGVSDGTSQFVARDSAPIKVLTKMLANAQTRADLTIVGHGAISFDAVALGLENTHDTQLLSYAVNERPKQHALQKSVIRNLQRAPWKDEVTWDWQTFDPYGPEWEHAALYNARDCKNTHDLFTRLWDLADDRQKRLYEKLLVPAAKTLARMEQNGVPISLANMEAARQDARERTEEARDVLVGLGLENPRSHKQVRTFLFETLRLTPHHLTDQGEPSTDAETLQALLLTNNQHSTVQAVSQLLTFREYDKLLTTYLTPEDGDIWNERVYPSYSLTETETGRTTGYGYLNPQRQPRRTSIRRIVAAPPGKLLLIGDLSQIELRTMAFLSREPNMMRIYRENLFGGDMHSFTAMKMAALRGETTFSKDDRSNAKPVNFSCLYGAEPYTLRVQALKEYGIRMSDRDASYFRNEVFFGTFERLPHYYRSILSESKRTGVVFSPLGRRRRIPNIVSSDGQLREEAARQAINTPNQSLASDIALIGTMLVDAHVPEVKLCSFVHDAFIGEVDERLDLEDIRMRVAYCFEVGVIEYLLLYFDVKFDVPIRLDVTLGKEWGVED
jgi:DNA polymerase I-like protein with 3'-5' exonuclease and polymerase domains